MVRKNGGKEKQDSVTTTKAFGCEQRPGRSERSPSQPENGHGRPQRRQRANAGRILRAVRRDEGVYEYRYLRHRIGVRLPGYQVTTVNFFITLSRL